jgi:hypothetical protein
MGARARVGFGVANVLVAALVAFSVFRGLPTRWWPTDFGGAMVAALFAASGAALLFRAERAAAITRVAAGVGLAIGLTAFAALAFTASWLWGVYGPIGKGGAAIFVLVAALVLPYLVALPIAELLWLGKRAPAEPAAGAPRAPGPVA